MERSPSVLGVCCAVLTAPHVACNAVHVPAERADDAPDPPPERTEDLVRGVRAPVAAQARLPAADAAARREDQRRLRLERRQVGAPFPSPSGRSLSTRADRAPFSFSVSVSVSVVWAWAAPRRGEGPQSGRGRALEGVWRRGWRRCWLVGAGRCRRELSISSISRVLCVCFRDSCSG